MGRGGHRRGPSAQSGFVFPIHRRILCVWPRAILYCGVADIVWREFAATAAIGVVCFVGALLRFRKALTAMQL